MEVDQQYARFSYSEITKLKIKRHHLLPLMYVSARTAVRSWAWPLEEMAADLNMSLRNVRRAISALTEAKLIKVSPTKHRQGQGWNEYKAAKLLTGKPWGTITVEEIRQLSTVSTRAQWFYIMLLSQTMSFRTGWRFSRRELINSTGVDGRWITDTINELETAGLLSVEKASEHDSDRRSWYHRADRIAVADLSGGELQICPPGSGRSVRGVGADMSAHSKEIVEGDVEGDLYNPRVEPEEGGGIYRFWTTLMKAVPVKYRTQWNVKESLFWHNVGALREDGWTNLELREAMVRFESALSSGNLGKVTQPWYKFMATRGKYLNKETWAEELVLGQMGVFDA